MQTREPNVVNLLFGSHLYGLDTPSSDIDYKGIYLPTTAELLLGNYPKTYKSSTGNAHAKNQAGDIDNEVISLPRFVSLACDGETFALDMLHCESPLSSSPIWESLVENRKRFYSKNMKAYIGYVRKQAAKYGLKGTRLACIRKSIESLSGCDSERPIGQLQGEIYEGEYAKWIEVKAKKEGQHDQSFYEVNSKKYQSTNTVEYVLNELRKAWNSYGERAKAAEKNEGVDWKAISHALRAGYQARDIYLDGDFSYPLRETDFIKAVKLGQLDYKTEVSPRLENLVDEVQHLADNANLPKAVDREYWGLWLLQRYNEAYDLDIKVDPFNTNFVI